MILPTRSDMFAASSKRCPRSSCPDYGKKLYHEAGQHEVRGDLTVEWYCMGCGYRESGPANPGAAKRTSPTVRSLAEQLRAVRLGGVEIPLVYTPDFPKGEFDAD